MLLIVVVFLVAGYTGQDCSTIIKDCSSDSDCQHNSTCQNGNCRCVTGYTGTIFSHSVSI